MELFLRLKHWHLFLLTFGGPFILQIILSVCTWVTSDPMIMLQLMPFVMFLFFAGYFGWLWAIGQEFQKMLPGDLKFSLVPFKILLLFPVVYVLFFFLMLDFFVVNMDHELEPSLGIFFTIIPLHLFTMFCIFYCIYFAARTFKATELQRPVTFPDFVGEFLMIWIFPLGIWFIQPRINKLIAEKSGSNGY